MFKAAILFAQKETIFLAPESSHAIKVAIDEALRCMSDYIPTDEELEKSFPNII